MNFFGTQPRMTQVPPTRYSSATADLGAGHGRQPRRAHAARARADDEQVVVVLAMVGLL